MYLSEEPEQDPWLLALAEFRSSLVDYYSGLIQVWNDANEVDAINKAAAGLNPDIWMPQFTSILTDIETWYRAQHDDFIRNYASEMKLSPQQWLFPPQDMGWLVSEARASISELRSSAMTLYLNAKESAEFNEEQSSMTGIVKGFVGGLLDPVNAFAGLLFDQSADDKELKKINNRLEASSSQSAYALDSLTAFVENSVIDRWNNWTLGTATKIDEEARRLAEEEAKRLAEEEAKRLAEEEAKRLAEELAKRKTEHEMGDTPKHSDHVFVTNLAHHATPAIASGPGASAGGRLAKLPMAAGAFLMILCVGLLVDRFWHFSDPSRSPTNPITASATPSQDLELVIVSKTDIRKGPGSSFSSLKSITTSTPAQALDRSVPGWVKIRVSKNLEGWVSAEATSSAYSQGP